MNQENTLDKAVPNKKNDIRAKVQWCLAISKAKGIDLEAQLTDALFDYINQNYRSVDSIKEAVGKEEEGDHSITVMKIFQTRNHLRKSILERLGIK